MTPALRKAIVQALDGWDHEIIEGENGLRVEIRDGRSSTIAVVPWGASPSEAQATIRRAVRAWQEWAACT